jgi:DNA-directed RNA polymerase subunit RPC12/RpoP
MNMNSDTGTRGEKGVVKRVACPNCGKRLQLLPKNYPMYDVQCTACSFRAQVKTNNCKPKNEIFGAGWDILTKVLKAGYMIPPLIVNFRWKENGARKQEIFFFPFVPRHHIRKTKAKRKDGKVYRMFNYIGLDQLPCLLLYPETTETRISLHAKTS